MASEKITAMIEEIKTLTVIELSELVSAIEEEFGVTAAAAVAVAGPAGGEAAAEEKTNFDVVLADVGATKIKVIKVVREITGLGLAEAKALLDERERLLSVKESELRASKEIIDSEFRVAEELGVRFHAGRSCFTRGKEKGGLPPEELKQRYPEFIPYEGKCRFRECLHDREPGCAVTDAAQRGLISEGRLVRYRALLQETREKWRERYD